MVRKPVSKIKVKVMEEDSQPKLASGFHTNIHMHVYAPIHICAHVTNTHTPNPKRSLSCIIRDHPLAPSTF